MRIVLSVHHELDEQFGAPGVTLRLGRAYADLGHEVSYLSFEDLPARLPLLAKEALYPEFAAWRLWRATRSERIDVIDASTGDAWIWGRLPGRRRRRPLLATRSHGLEHRFWQQTVDERWRDGAPIPKRTALFHGGLRLWEVAASLRSADLCLLLNREDRDYAVKHLHVTPDRVHVVPNGLPEPLLDRPLQPRSGSPRLAHIGSWAERKGTRYLVPALSEALLAHPTATVTLLGTRRPREEVAAEFPSEVRDRVTVVPEYAQCELPALLAGHWMTVSASLAEGFSLGLPEAMSCGLAPIATAIPGTVDLIDDGESGLLVPARDPARLASAIAGLLADERTLDQLRTVAHARVQELSWHRIARHTIELYEAGLAVAQGVE